MTNKNLSKRKSIYIVAITFLLLAVITTVSIAFLTDFYETDNTAIIGSVKIGLYKDNGNTLISGYENDGEYVLGAPILVTLGSTLSQPTSVDLWIKNTGNINGLVRVMLNITYKPENDEKALILNESDASINNTGWVNQYADTSSAGTRALTLYAYYNNQVAPNTAIRVLESITPKTAKALSAVLEIIVRADIIAYSGNAYQLEEEGTIVNSDDKPFKDFFGQDLTSTFLNNWTAWR